jgi:hypothetical protein
MLVKYVLALAAVATTGIAILQGTATAIEARTGTIRAPSASHVEAFYRAPTTKEYCRQFRQSCQRVPGPNGYGHQIVCSRVCVR